MQTRLTNRTADSAEIQAKPYEIRDADIKGFLLRVQPSGVKSYYYEYRAPDGKKQRTWIGKHGSVTAVQARDAAQLHSGKASLGNDIQKEKKQTRQKTEQSKFSTLEGFLDLKYQPWVEAQRKTGAVAVRRLKGNFSHLLKRPLNDINLWVIEKWRSERLKGNKKPSTVNRDIATLKAALSRAVDWGVIDKNPLAKFKKLKIDNKSKVRYLKPDEEKQLRAALEARDQRMKLERANANIWRKERDYELYPDLTDRAFVDHLRPLVLLALNTGMRRGELFNLTWQNVSLSKATLTIEGVDAKSGKTRHLPLNKEALETLKSWQADVGASAGIVFQGRDGARLDNISTSWANLLVDAKIKDFRFHDLRHHFASKLVMAGVDLNTVRELLGHSDYTMTLRYAHLAPEHKKDAVERLLAA